MIAAREGSRFSFEDDFFSSMIQNILPQERETEFGGRNIYSEVSNAFMYAWAVVFSERSVISDGPIVKVSFPKPWNMDAGTMIINIKGFYYKSYNNSNDVLVLVESEGLPLRAHLLSGPFLSAILASKRLIAEKKLGVAAGKGLGRSLAEGFAVYGPPLSDPLPLPADKIRELAKDVFTGHQDNHETSDVLFLEAQRFGRGWLVARSPLEPKTKTAAEIWNETEID
jgi:hypothetical protein